MKRTTFFILLFIMSGHLSVFSQDDSSAPDIEGLTSKLEKSNKNLENPKKNIEPKTWIERGKLFQSIASANTQFLRYGVSKTEVKLYMKDPKSIVTGPKAGMEQYVYDRVTLNFNNGKLESWKETKQIVQDPTGEAFKSYKKATELDVNGKYNSSIAEGLKSLKTLLQKEAVNNYSLNDYKAAFESFKQILDVNEMKQINFPNDTIFIYNTGLTASIAGLNDEAIKYLTKAADLNYKDPSVYKGLKDAYFAKKDTANGLKALEKGVVTYPNNTGILGELINYYISIGDKEKAINFLGKAKANDPKNKTYYFAEGALYSKMCDNIENQSADIDKAKRKELSDIDEAKKAEFRKTGNNMKKYQPIKDKYQKLSDAAEDKYKAKNDSLIKSYADMQVKVVEQYQKAIEIEPTYFDPYYNLGVLYFNNGTKIYDQAAKEVDNDKYEAKKALGDQELKKSLSYFEKANQVNPKDRETMLNMKKLYYRLKMTDKYDNINKQLEESK